MPKPLDIRNKCELCKRPPVYDKRCELHMTGNSRVLRNYKLKFQETRIHELTDSPALKSLREEISIMRLMLETVINRCNDETDFLVNQGRIGDLITRIEKTVSTCDRIEKNSGLTLDKTVVINIAQQMIDIIAKHITDPDVLDAIANEFSGTTLKAIEQAQETK